MPRPRTRFRGSTAQVISKFLMHAPNLQVTHSSVLSVHDLGWAWVLKNTNGVNVAVRLPSGALCYAEPCPDLPTGPTRTRLRRMFNSWSRDNNELVPLAPVRALQGPSLLLVWGRRPGQADLGDLSLAS